MKFCPVVSEICRGQVHGARKERRITRTRIIIIIIIIRSGAKTISLQLNNTPWILQYKIHVQLNLVVSNSVSSNFGQVKKFLKSRFKLIVFFNLIYSSYLKFRYVEISGISEVAFQSLIYKSIQIMFVMSKLSIKSINKPVKVSIAWSPVLTASGEIYFDNC